MYSFGGEEAKSSPLAKKTVYKYNRMADEWTAMPDMPVPTGGPAPNCAKINNFQNAGRDVILCFGARFEGGDMFAFDMGTETWEDLGITAPTPPSHLSTMFIHNNNLYRYAKGSYICILSMKKPLPCHQSQFNILP